MNSVFLHRGGGGSKAIYRVLIITEGQNMAGFFFLLFSFLYTAFCAVIKKNRERKSKVKVKILTDATKIYVACH